LLSKKDAAAAAGTLFARDDTLVQKDPKVKKVVAAPPCWPWAHSVCAWYYWLLEPLLEQRERDELDYEGVANAMNDRASCSQDPKTSVLLFVKKDSERFNGKRRKNVPRRSRASSLVPKINVEHCSLSSL